MIPTFDKIHLKFKLNGINYSHEELKEVAYSLVKEGEPYERTVGDFLLDWLNDKDYLQVKSSGSTGTPKDIRIQKQAMVYSSIATGNYFKLQPGDSALHCLPTNYIAGKMMLIRAMILGLEIDLVEPTSLPIFDDYKHYDFCAMIPMQIQNSLNRLKNIRTIIVGGAPISKSLIDNLQPLKTKVYATYGMTETVSHIAIKPLNIKSQSDHYKILGDIEISQDDRNCLVVNAPKLSEHIIVTNDIVKLHSKTEFEFIGRYDNMINSGSIKLFPELVEAKLRDKIKERFFIASEPDTLLGEKVVLVIEGKEDTTNASTFEDLDFYEIPKKVYAVEKFIEINEKIQRSRTLEELKKQSQ
ncbi:MAG TPA: AMP-binding protein [Flavobacteriaceae bacterium]